MASLNKVLIIGHLGRDPETRYLPSGEAVCNISVATSERYKDKQTGELREATEWHKVGLWGKAAEVVGQYAKKGTLIYIEGSIKTRKYADKQGVEKTATEIRADRFQFLGGKGDAGGSHGEPAAPAPQRQPEPAQRQSAPASSASGFDDMDDDIPF